MASAETRLRASPQERYRSGLATQLPMLTAEATLLQARQRWPAWWRRARSSASRLLLTVGGGFEPPDDPNTKIAKQDISP